MEEGAFGFDVGVTGYPNGAVYAFLLYVVVIIISFWVFKRLNIISIPDRKDSDMPFGSSPYIAFSFINLFYLLLMLFGFGGLQVLLGTVGKGEFRANFGFFGSIPFFIFRYFSPILLTYLAFDFRKSKGEKIKSIFFFINTILIMLIGLSWGAKSAAVLMLIPCGIIYFWDIKWYKVLLIFGLSLVFFMFTAVLFDGSSFSASEFSLDVPTPDNALAVVMYRMTVLQGNVAWYVWELYNQGYHFPPYAPTLLAAFGDKFLSLFAGVNLSDMNEFANYHFDVLLTSLATGSYESRIKGHNITGTAFVDGIFIGGLYGVVFISVFAGFVCGQCYNIINRSIRYNNYITGSLGAVYFFAYVFTWLNGGGIVILFHISAIIGLVATWVYLKFIHKIRITKKGVYFPRYKAI